MRIAYEEGDVCSECNSEHAPLVVIGRLGNRLCGYCLADTVSRYIHSVGDSPGLPPPLIELGDGDVTGGQ